MPITELTFYAFSLVMLASAVAVITVRNPVYAALWLVLTFFSAACIWMLLEVEFLAIILILVYVGAVMVLFLFVVMMLDINVERVQAKYAQYLPLGVLVAGLMVVELALIIWGRAGYSAPSGSFATNPEGYSNTEALGAVLYTEHVYAFEIAAVILLLAIVAAITLTMRKRPGLKQQDVSAQVAVRARDRVRIFKMSSESREASE